MTDFIPLLMKVHFNINALGNRGFFIFIHLDPKGQVVENKILKEIWITKNIIFEKLIYNVSGTFNNRNQTGAFGSDKSKYTNIADEILNGYVK